MTRTHRDLELAGNPPPLPDRQSGLPVTAAAVPSTYVRTLETNVGDCDPVTEFLAAGPPDGSLSTPLLEYEMPWHPEDDPDQSFFHSGWAPLRRRIDDSFGRIHINERRRYAFRGCGTDPWVYQCVENPEEYRVKAAWCHDRFCQVCAGQRSRHIASVILAKIGDVKPLMITLTLCDTSNGLRDALKRLMVSFRLLRETEIWKRKIRGGAWFLEVKYSSRSARWHPHIHIIADGDYLPGTELTGAWSAITGDSFHTDITREHDHGKIGGYCTKYASKPLNPSFSGDPALLDEAILACVGKRLCSTFGTWRGLKLADSGPVPEAEADILLHYNPVCRLSELFQRIKAGNATSAHILVCLERAKSRPPPGSAPA